MLQRKVCVLGAFVSKTAWFAASSIFSDAYLDGRRELNKKVLEVAVSPHISSGTSRARTTRRRSDSYLRGAAAYFLVTDSTLETLDVAFHQASRPKSASFPI